MEEKLKSVIKDIESHVEWEQELINKCSVEIKEYAQKYAPENMVVFLPSKIKELEDAINRKEKYIEQLNMLQFIQKNN